MKRDACGVERPAPYSEELRAAINEVDLAALRLRAAIEKAELQMRYLASRGALTLR